MKKLNHFGTPNIYTLLHDLTVRNSDNGAYFTDTRRLEKFSTYIENELHRKVKCIVLDVTESELVDKDHCIQKTADIDETSIYHVANDIKCFSFCISVELMDPEGRYAPWGGRYA